MAGHERSDTRPASATGQRQSAKVSAPAAPLYEVSAQHLAQAYDRNTVAADQQFKGKRFKVSGVFGSINTDLFGNPYVTLLGGVIQFMEPQFELDGDHANYAGGLQSGMRISAGVHGVWRCSEDAHVQGLRTSKLTGLPNSIAYGFTHAPSVDKVTCVA